MTMDVPEFMRRKLPKGARVKAHFPSAHIADVRKEVHDRLLGAELPVRAGQRIAITAGSRGMGGFIELLDGIAAALRALGAEPFVIPAMGSHGGAVAEGQAEILRRLGVNEATVGARVEATMETITLGVAKNGAAAHLDGIAAEADGIIVLGRVKTHPESARSLASGLLKMTVVGLGKQRGAQEAHNHGLWGSVREVPRVVLGKAKIVCGVAVVENAYRRPVVIEVVPPSYEAFLDADERLLEIAKGHFATLPFGKLDVLIVDEIGKNISGAGMDPNIVGRWRVSCGPRVPDFKRIAALSLTPESMGNGMGIGIADFTTERFLRAFDPQCTYINLLTAQEPTGGAREASVPLALPSDQTAVEVALYASLAGQKPRVCRIKNTAALEEIWVSEALFDEVDLDPKLSRLGEPERLAFDAAGNLF